MAPVSQTAPLRQGHRLATGMNACTDFDMLGVADAAPQKGSTSMSALAQVNASEAFLMSLAQEIVKVCRQ